MVAQLSELELRAFADQKLLNMSGVRPNPKPSVIRDSSSLELEDVIEALVGQMICFMRQNNLNRGLGTLKRTHRGVTIGHRRVAVMRNPCEVVKIVLVLPREDICHQLILVL